MKRINLSNQIAKALLVLVMCFTFSIVKAQNVLIIYDDSTTNINTVSLSNALTLEGFTVSFSAVSEFNWDNSNPSLCGYEAVIHLNGTTYTEEMPSVGQLALVDYVENNNGIYVGFEWNAYQVSVGEMQDMLDLVLFDRVDGNGAAPFAVTTVPVQVGHPVLAGVVSPFNLTASVNVGPLHTFAVDPSMALMTINVDPAVAIRSFGTGHVLGFSNAGNYNGLPALSNVNIQKMIVNFINEYSTPYLGLGGVDTQVACDSLTWLDGITYTTSNSTATYTATNAIGCDSVIVLNLTINNSTVSTDTQVACDSLTWIDGNTYTANNTVAMYTATSVNGCDSLITLNLTINNSTIGTDTQVACDSLTWIDGITYTMSNSIATHTLTNLAGCDSVVTLDLTITDIDVSTTEANLIISANNTTALSYQWINCNDNSLMVGETNTNFTVSQDGEYAVVITEGSCSDTSDCVMVTGVGIEEKSELNVNIYPNPNKGEFTIQTLNGTGLVNIYAVDGKIIVKDLKITESNQFVNLKGIEGGVYYVKVMGISSQKTIRLVVD
jgi:hypothetical protein